MFLRSGKYVPGPSAQAQRGAPQPVANPPRPPLPREAGPAPTYASSAGPARYR